MNVARYPRRRWRLPNVEQAPLLYFDEPPVAPELFMKISKGLSCAVAMLSLACSSSDRQASATAGAHVPHWVLSSKASLTISGDIEGNKFFKGIAGGTRMRNGDILVGDARSGHLKMFDSTGLLKRVIEPPIDTGRSVRMLRWVGRCAGSGLIAAQDIQVRRIWFFSDSGALVSSVNIPRSLIYTRLLACRADGSMLVLRKEPGAIPKEKGDIDIKASLLQVNVRGALEGRVQHFDGSVFFFGRRTPAYVDQPLAPAAFAVAGDGKVFVGRSDRPSLDVRDFNGEKIGKINLSLIERAPTIGDVVDAVASRIADEPTSRTRTIIRRVTAEAPIPKRLPLYDGMLMDSNGLLWLRTMDFASDSARRWMIVGAEGVVHAVVDVPKRLRILEIGDDYLLCVDETNLRDELLQLVELRRTRLSNSK